MPLQEDGTGAAPVAEAEGEEAEGEEAEAEGEAVPADSKEWSLTSPEDEGWVAMARERMARCDGELEREERRPGGWMEAQESKTCPWRRL